MQRKKTKKIKKEEWHLWARYGQGHVQWVTTKKIVDDDTAKVWAQKELEKLMKSYKISECYISTGTGESYRTIKLYKNFYWIKHK